MKAQSAIEYLMTYGWMLLVVAIAGGAVFSMVGEQNIEHIQGFESNDINFQDFGISKTSLMFSMTDPVGQTFVREITVSNPDTTNVSYITNQDISQNELVNLPGITTSDQSNNLEVEVNYDAGNLHDLRSTGEIQGSLEIAEEFHNRNIIIQGLVGYWSLSETFSEDTEVYDLSEQDNRGEKINNPEFIDGKKGIEFDPEENQIIQGDLNSGDLEEYTLIGWVSPSTVPFESDYGNGRIVTTNSGGSSRTFIGANSGSDRFRFQHNSDTGAESISGGTAVQGETFMVAGVFDNPQMELFVNADSVATGEVEGPLLESHNFGIGKWVSGDSHKWDGVIREGYIYDRALSDQEIQTIYNSSNNTE